MIGLRNNFRSNISEMWLASTFQNCVQKNCCASQSKVSIFAVILNPPCIFLIFDPKILKNGPINFTFETGNHKNNKFISILSKEFWNKSTVIFRFSNGHIFKFKFQNSTVKNIFKKFPVQFWLRYDGTHINNTHYRCVIQKNHDFWEIDQIQSLF